MSLYKNWEEVLNIRRKFTLLKKRTNISIKEQNFKHSLITLLMEVEKLLETEKNAQIVEKVFSWLDIWTDITVENVDSL